MQRLTSICLGILLLSPALPGAVALAQTGSVQTQTGSVHGTVTDPTGAVIPSSTVTLTSKEGAAVSATSNATGGYEFGRVEPGRYTITAAAPGFASQAPAEVLIFAGKSLQKDLALQVQADVQQVKVDSENPGLDTSPENNTSAIVIKGKALDALSDDPDELQNELSALAGPSAGPNGGQIYIDGFTGGQLPPKASIREIRINSNPFSAEYDKLGYGRIEILTKPGTDKLHGSFMMNGNDAAMNSLNPFVTSEPSYYSTFLMANAGGRLTQASSWFVSVFRRDNQTNSIINALLPGSGPNGAAFTQAVATPQTRLDVSPRFDFQLGASNTLTVRYMFDRNTATNYGVSGFSLLSQGINSSSHENTLQVSDTQVLNQHAINETRFQYMGDRTNSAAVSSDPAVIVESAFTSGGNSQGVTRDRQDNYELQNLTMISEGRHSITFGARLRDTRDSNYSTAGFNGQYIYSGLDAYAAHTPLEYTVTAGNPSARLNYYDLGFYFQDDYKLRPSFTFSYGVRYETQNAIGDHNDWGPRLSFAWAPGVHGGKPARTVIRGGYGWFFDRFTATNIMNTIRFNGASQQQYIVMRPDFYQDAPTSSELTASSTSAPTLYNFAPNMKATLNMQAAIGIEHQFSRSINVSATYLNSRGLHEYLTNDINAFELGTYDPLTGTGVRPNGINENVYQYQSNGAYKQNQLIANYSIGARQISLFGFYTLNFANANTSGANYFPSNPYDLNADYGRASFDIRQRFLLGGNLQAPFGIAFSPMLSMNSGTPYDITLGEDLYGDGQVNARPAFATASSTNVKDGFDLTPAWNDPRIPVNMGTGPGQVSMNLRVSKSFGIGPKVEATGNGRAFMGGAPPPGGMGGRGGMGRMGGGGLGPGGLNGGGRGGFMRMNNGVPRRYSLSFSAMAHNAFNHQNLAPPVGDLNSPLYGKSTGLAGGFFSSGASNRSIDVQASFNF